MSKNEPNRWQHKVTKSYLKQWPDPNSRRSGEWVWVFPKERGEPRQKSPKSLFAEYDVYTIKVPGIPGYRDLRIEDGLRELEDSFCDTRNKFVEPRKPIPQVRLQKLIAFMMAMNGRTDAAKERVRSLLRPTINFYDSLPQEHQSKPVACSVWDVTREEAHHRRMRGEHSMLGRTTLVHIDTFRRIYDQPFQTTLESYMQVIMPVFLQFNPHFLCKDSGVFFNTSEDPCLTWFTQHRPFRPFRDGAPGRPSVIAAMPISPRRLMLLTDVKVPQLYQDVDDATAHRFNAILRAHTQGSFVSNSEHDHGEWYSFIETVVLDPDSVFPAEAVRRAMEPYELPSSFQSDEPSTST